MRLIIIAFLALICSKLLYANYINIATTTEDGHTCFFLQAGAFNLEKDAQQRQQELATRVKQPIKIKKLADKHLYLVQIGPINEYLTAKLLQEQLSQHPFKSNQTTDLSLKQSMLTPGNTHTPPTESNLWNLRNADIRGVIAEVSRITGKNFVIDPRVQGKISIVSSSPINHQELYQVFLSVLQVSGYAAIPSGAVTKIIPSIDAKIPSSAFNSPKGDDMLVTVVPIHYVPAEQLVPVLRPLMPQWSTISAYVPSNMLILSGRANNIHNLAQIIKQVDNSSANGVDIVHLNHSLAMDITSSLKELIKSQPMGSNRSQMNIAADDRSNSILVSGSKIDRIRLRMLILKLDKERSTDLNANTQVVYLNYLRAEDLVPILAGVAQANFSGNVGTTIGTITRGELDSTDPTSNLANKTSMNPTSSSASLITSPATINTSSVETQNEGTSKPSVQIIGEPNTNSIIMNAPTSVIRILRKVISQLDIKPAQLLIEALVAEVNQEDVNDLGIEWGSDLQTSKDSDFQPGFAIINNKTRIDDFQAQIYALAKAHKANILSTPSVVVLDNRQAKILVGKQVSVASTNYPNNANGSAPSSSPYTTFERINVALHLYVRPQITQGQGIQLQIDQGNDTLDPATTAATATTPTFRISSIVTSVHVESGDIVVLGGLTQDSLGNDNKRLPIIGDIPGIGRLFQHQSTIREKRVLMVFIKPIILRNERDSMHMTGEKYTNVRQYQLDWLRSEDAYLENNKTNLMPALKQAKLPKPFNRSPRKAT